MVGEGGGGLDLQQFLIHNKRFYSWHGFPYLGVAVPPSELVHTPRWEFWITIVVDT